MTLEAFPLQDVAEQGTAERLRHMVYCMLQRGSSVGSVVGGLIAATDLQTTYAGAGLKVETSAGEIIVPGYTATTGGYLGRSTGVVTTTPSAANVSNPRVDLLVAQVEDASLHGSGNAFGVNYLEGTPTASATLVNKLGAQAAPAGSLALAYILVPANASTITNTDILNVATAAQLGLENLDLVYRSTSATLTAGETALFTSSATATLPNTSGVITILAGPAATVKVKAGVIYGDFVVAASEITLLPNQHVTLLGTTSGEWKIIAGEPKREQTYGALTEYAASTPETPSTTRPTFVSLLITLKPEAPSQMHVKVGGVQIATLGADATLPAGVPQFPYSFICPPGVAWEWVNNGASKVEASYLSL
jgi:hypothetical protein